jgi:hypothetical protein
MSHKSSNRARAQQTRLGVTDLRPRAPSFLTRACRGSGDRERLVSSSGPADHPKRHALLRAAVAGPDPLEPAFCGRPSAAIDRGAGSTPSLVKRPSLGPLLSGSRPNSRELVGFGECSTRVPVNRGVRLLHPGSWRSLQGHCGASCKWEWRLLGSSLPLTSCAGN